MRLALYLSRQIAARIVAVLLGFLALGLGLDLLENAAGILDRRGAEGLAEYALFRAPLILLTVLPIGVLVGAAFAFLTLAIRSEMVILRAAGLNTSRILMLLLPLAILLGAAQSLLAARVAPAAEEALSERFPDVLDVPEIAEMVWLHDWTAEIRIARIEEKGAVLKGVEMFRLDAAGALTEKLSAAAIRFADGRWQMDDVTVTRPNALPERLATTEWTTRLTPATILRASRRPVLVDAGEVQEVLAGELPGGRGIPFYAVQFWRRYAAYLVPLVMLTFAAMASFGLSRSGGGMRYIAYGLGGGALFMVVDGVLNSLGQIGALGPALAVFVAPAIFLLVGLWTIVYIEE